MGMKTISGIVNPRIRLAIGQMVKIEGLKKRADLNGKYGNVEGYKDDRYVVNLEIFSEKGGENGSNYKVGKVGYTHGLSVEEKNGLECELLELQENGRWLVKIYGNEQLS